MTSKFRKPQLLIFIILIQGFFLSCNYTKHLSQNQTLLRQNKINLKLLKPIKYRGELESSILSLAPQPNTHMLDLDFLPKYKLWKYNNRHAYFLKNPSSEKITKHKVEKPVLVDTNLINKAEKSISQFMINQGYFYAQVNTQIKEVTEKQGEVIYSIISGKNFKIKDIIFNAKNPNIQWALNQFQHESFLIKGETFTNFKCGSERDRIYKLMRNLGYYDFKTDNVNFIIDTSNSQKLKELLADPFEQIFNYTASDTTLQPETDSLRVLVSIEQSRDSTFATSYQIDSVIVELKDYPLDQGNAPYYFNELNGTYFHYQHLPINRNVITRNIFIQSGDIYNASNVEATINRLNQLSVFQFVNIRFDKYPDKPGKLSCKIFLNTAPKMDLVGLTDLSTSDGDYLLGIGASLTYRNKNLFHGANQLSIRAAPSIEFRNDALLSEKKEFYVSGKNINISSNLTFPKFIVPFNQNIFSKRNMPYSILGFNYSYIERKNNYTIINVTGSFGYSWIETQQKSWRVNPSFLTLTFVPPHLLGNEFSEKRKNNTYLQNIFSNNTIYGENMTYEYKSKPKYVYGSFSTIKIGLEEAGTILKGINQIYKLISSKNIDPIAHYVRLDADYRKYINRRKSQWVNRIMLGLGVPIANNNALPYIKQYSSGGSFSIRGWRSRTLGPGRSSDSSYQTANSIIDRTGDIKLEINSEYRFNLLKLFSGAINLKGAGFVDAGNIWLFNKDENIKGGEINAAYFLNDIAVASGLGLRLDFSFFVFRVDLGFPIKQPQKTTNYGFAFDELKFRSGIWNIALGYAF